MQLINLPNTSPEADIILTDFAKRQRVHSTKPVTLRLLRYQLQRAGHTVDKLKFIKAFRDLHEMGYGDLTYTTHGTIKEFLPNLSLKEIGRKAYEKQLDLYPPKEQSPVNVNKVTVLFKLKGQSCSATIPQDAIPMIESLLNMG